jgi:hypothetical protein
MAGRPQRQELDAPTASGSTAHSVIWTSVHPSSANDGDVVAVIGLDGLDYDLEAGLAGAVAENNGEVVEGPAPVTVAGRSGLMATATVHRPGIDGYIRIAAVVVGNRVVIAAVVTDGQDRRAGQQGFADLVASINQY